MQDTHNKHDTGARKLRLRLVYKLLIQTKKAVAAVPDGTVALECAGLPKAPAQAEEQKGMAVKHSLGLLCSRAPSFTKGTLAAVRCCASSAAKGGSRSLMSR